MRKLSCIILIIIILLSYNISIFAENSEETIEKQEKSIEDLQKEADEINKQIAEDLAKLQLVEEELSQNLMQVQEIDTKIQSSEQELNKLNQEVETLSNNIKNVENELKEKQIKFNKINKQAEEIIISMYENGSIEYLDVLLGSDNIVDFISNYFLVNEILEYNVELVKEAAKQKQEIEQEVQQLENQKEDIISKKKEQQKKKQVLENTKTSREYYLAKLTEEETQIQTQIEEYKMQMSAVETEIRSLSLTQSFGEDYIGGDMIWPIPGHTKITSQYGMRTHPITGLYSLHTGTDVSAPIGTNFIAMATGVVTKARV